MKKKKIKNPLTKRIPRELLGDWKKYFVVSLFLILTIGFVSGMYVANGSMMKAADESVTKYKLEDGHFELESQADDKLLTAIQSGEKADVQKYYLDEAKKELDEEFEPYQEAYDEAYPEAYDEAWEEIQEEIDEEYAEAEEKYELNDPDFQPVPVKVYENFYRNEEEDNDNDGNVDGTIRMHADNAGIGVGDTITVSGQTYQVVGLIAYVNYSTLHEKSTDLIFDALKFDVAMVTESGFERLNNTLHYAYAWQYETQPTDDKEEKSLSDDFMKALLTQTVVEENEIEDYMPRYANPAINFATEDMGSDEAMGGVLLDILIVIIAFIFAVTISNTIAKEASAIGTLRASGYTKGELIRHYLSMPVIVTILAATIGNSVCAAVCSADISSDQNYHREE